MTVQATIFDGRELRDQGIQRACDHAEQVSKDWNKRADIVLRDFLDQHTGTFLAEEVRSYAAEIDFDLPPSARAWGGVIVRAKIAGVIKQVGFGQVKNPKAHMANSAVWCKTERNI